MCECACDEADLNTPAVYFSFARSWETPTMPHRFIFLRRPRGKVTESPDLGATLPKPKPGFNTHYSLVLENVPWSPCVSPSLRGICTKACRVLVSAPGMASAMEEVAVILTKYKPSSQQFTHCTI